MRYFLTFIFFLGFFGSFFCGSKISFAADPKIMTGLPIAFSGTDLVSNEPARFELKGKEPSFLVVLFLSAKCPCSASHEVVLEKLHQEFGKRGFRFVGIHSNSDEPLEYSFNHFRSSGFSFPVIHDPKSELADIFSAYKTPHVFILNSQQEIVFQGGVDSSHQAQNAKKHYMEDALKALVAGNQPAERYVRVLGCSIRRP